MSDGRDNGEGCLIIVFCIAALAIIFAFQWEINTLRERVAALEVEQATTNPNKP